MGTKTHVRKLLIKADERLYLIEVKNYGSIYESQVGDQYSWKNVAISMIEPSVNQVCCLYLMGGIYIAATDCKNIRQYFKFDLSKKSFTDIAFYNDNLALRRSGGNLEVMKYPSHTFKPKTKHAAAYIKEKFTLFYLEQCFEKIKRYNTAIKLNPDSADNYKEKGSILHEMGRNLEAIEFFNKAIKLDPNNGRFYWEKGSALHDLGKHIKAIKCFDKAIKFNDEIVRSLAFLGKGAALRALGRDLEAIECYDGVAKSDTFYSLVLIAKGSTLCSLNRNLEAVECFDLAFNNNPIPYALIRKGHALYELGKYFEAMDCYNKAIEIDPDNFIFLGYRACLFNYMGQEVEALQDLNEAYELMNRNKIYDKDLFFFSWSINSFDGELIQETIELLKMLSKFQEGAIEFKKEMQKLSDDHQSYPEIHKEIAEKERIIKEQHSKLLKRAVESIQSNPIEIIQQIKNDINELQRERSDIATQLWLLLPKQ